MRSPFAPLQFFFFILVLIFLVTFVQVGALVIAFDKLGLSANSAFLLLFASLFGSAINLPLFLIRTTPPETQAVIGEWHGLLRVPQWRYPGRTLVAVNVGGCVIPVAFSLYLMLGHPISIMEVLAGVTLVTMLCRVISRPIPGLGIGMPVFVAPLAAALAAILINAENSAPLAYISGTMGVLIGADMLRLGDIRKLGTPFASIGGAGTFDGIFITGIVAVLLA